MVKNEEGVNEVNVSDERIDAEVAAIMEEEGIEPEQLSRDAPEIKPETKPETGPEVSEDRAAYAGRLGGLLSSALHFGFKVFAPAWEVTKVESKNLGQTWGAVFEKYLPISWLKYAPDSGGDGECVECNALAATIEVVAPRLEAMQQPGSEEQPAKAAPVMSEAVSEVADEMLDVHAVGAGNAAP